MGGDDGREPQQRPQARIDLDLLPLRHRRRGRASAESKGGFATRKEAEAARVEALAALSSGNWVQPDRLTVAEFLLDEWLDLNALYRTLLDSGRRPPGSPVRRHDPAVLDLIARLKGEGHTWQQVADIVAGEFPDLEGITRHAVASAHRRAQEPKPAPKDPGLGNRMVRYVHTIIHAALRDALRWNRVTRNVAAVATPPPQASTRRGRHTTWTGEQLGQFVDFVADSPYLPAWLFLATSGSRRARSSA